MKFGVIIKQEGEGCDYTIGCGIDFRTMIAESIGDCIKKLCELDEDCDDDCDESDEFTLASIFDQDDCTLESCIVFPIDSSVEILRDFNIAWKQREKKLSEKSSAYEEAKERAEFERLSKKFK